ncbi:MAG: hypothetical protein ACRCSN_15750 [Dermatophilaceae bacterium]
MTQQQMTEPARTAEEEYRAEYERLWDAAVAALTDAVRLGHPVHEALDFADFLASALGAVAGNVGSTDRVTAGRPGSWESDLLDQLVTGTVGDDPDLAELAGRRTEPVVVRLNVAQLVGESRQDAPVEDRAGMLLDIDDALDSLWESQDNQEPIGAELAEWDAAEEQLRRRYVAAFETYGQRFTAAVNAAAREVPGLAVPVEVRVEADPRASWWDPGEVVNPQEWDEVDELAWRLWTVARQRVGLPVLEPADTGPEEGADETTVTGTAGLGGVIRADSEGL